jgi:hypothetical protein
VTVRAVAWVPEAETRPLDEAAAFAGAWLRQQARDYGDRIGVVTPVIQEYMIDDVDRLGWKTSRRSGRERVPDGTLGVLAYVPGWDELEFATGLARDGSLVAVEETLTPLEGWARWHQAVDLITGEVTEPLADDLRTVVERLKFYGNNGFARGFGRDQALRVVRDVPADAHGLVLGALLAAGQRSSGVKRLADLLQ